MYKLKNKNVQYFWLECEHKLPASIFQNAFRWRCCEKIYIHERDELLSKEVEGYPQTTFLSASRYMHSK